MANYQRGGAKGKKPDPIDRPAQIREAREKRERMLERAARFKGRQKN